MECLYICNDTSLPSPLLPYATAPIVSLSYQIVALIYIHQLHYQITITTPISYMNAHIIFHITYSTYIATALVAHFIFEVSTTDPKCISTALPTCMSNYSSIFSRKFQPRCTTHHSWFEFSKSSSNKQATTRAFLVQQIEENRHNGSQCRQGVWKRRGFRRQSRLLQCK